MNVGCTIAFDKLPQNTESQTGKVLVLIKLKPGGAVY